MRTLLLLLIAFLTSIYSSQAQNSDFIVHIDNDTTYCKIKRVDRRKIYFIDTTKQKLYNPLSEVIGYKRGKDDFTYIEKVIRDTLTRKEHNAVFKKNAVYADLFGLHLLYSLNYERLLPISSNFIVSGRIGASMDHVGSYDFPVLINLLAGGNGSYGELGLGTIVDLTHYELSDKWETQFLPGIYTGFRYQRPNGKFLFRSGISGAFFHVASWPIPLMSFGLGYRIK